MPLQNRVDPFGEIHAVVERGMFTGNRGIIHDPETKTLLRRRWTLPAWIICVCDFKGGRRIPMGRNGPGDKAGWTELFFLDEVTALAAGHRPCFRCQRPRADAFLRGFGEVVGEARPRAPQLDRRLHRERLASGGVARKLAAIQLAFLPDGTMVALAGQPHAVKDGRLLAWSFAGYRTAPNPLDGTLTLITPPTSIAVLRGGYQPVWHLSAGP